MIFGTNSERFLSSLKNKLGQTFDVKFFDMVIQFIGWEIQRHLNGILISQGRFVSKMLRKYDMEKLNGTLNQMAADANISLCYQSEVQLCKSD